MKLRMVPMFCPEELDINSEGENCVKSRWGEDNRKFSSGIQMEM